VSSSLEKKAESQDYITLVRGEARQTVEEFVSDWIIKEHGWSAKDRPVVKVYFEDEKDIPFPAGKTLSDFLQ
jgi:nucleoid-associated protein YejK